MGKCYFQISRNGAPYAKTIVAEAMEGVVVNDKVQVIRELPVEGISPAMNIGPGERRVITKYRKDKGRRSAVGKPSAIKTSWIQG